jgi:adenylate kinase
MIVFFGPAGAGKSVQGQMLAARHGWRWLSAGQLLRDTHDIEIIKEMQTGKLLPADTINKIMKNALIRSKHIERVIIDGYPRDLSQAKYLVESQPEHERSIGIVIVLEVPQSELINRLTVRGRVDDEPEVITERHKIYRAQVYPILNYFTEKNINIVHIDGTGTVGQVHDRIMDELVACKLV